MAGQWHYQHGGRNHGPVTVAELKESAVAGELLPSAAPPAASTTDEGTPPPVPGLDRSQAFVLAGLIGLFLLAVSTFLPWHSISGISFREGKLIFLLAASAGAFLLASSLLKEHAAATNLVAAAVGTLSAMMLFGQIITSLRYRGSPGSGDLLALK